MNRKEREDRLFDVARELFVGGLLSGKVAKDNPYEDTAARALRAATAFMSTFEAAIAPASARNTAAVMQGTTEAHEIIKHYNALAGPAQWAPVGEVRPELLGRIRGSLRANPLPVWLERLDRCSRSSFLNGQGHSALSFVVNLAYLLQPATAAKIDAGQFDDHQHAAQPANVRRASGTAEAAMRLMDNPPESR